MPSHQSYDVNSAEGGSPTARSCNPYWVFRLIGFFVCCALILAMCSILLPRNVHHPRNETQGQNGEDRVGKSGKWYSESTEKPNNRTNIVPATDNRTPITSTTMSTTKKYVNTKTHSKNNSDTHQLTKPTMSPADIAPNQVEVIKGMAEDPIVSKQSIVENGTGDGHGSTSDATATTNVLPTTSSTMASVQQSVGGKINVNTKLHQSDKTIVITTAVTTDKPTDQPSATSDSISTDGNVQTTTAVTTDKPTDQPSATSDSISTDGDVQTTTAVTTDKPTDQPSATSDSISTDGNVQTTTAVTTDKPTDQPSATSDSISTDGNVQTTTAVTTDKPTDQPSATSDSISTDGDVQTTTAVTTDKPTDQPSATSDSISTDGNVQTTTAVTTDKPTDQPSATSDSISTDGDVQTTTAVTTDKPTDQPSATSDSISTDGNVQTTTAVTTDKPTDQPSATSDSISTDGDVQTTTAVTTDKPTDQPSATSDSISTDGNVQTTTAVTTDKPTDQPSATSDSISTDGDVQTTTAVTTDKPTDQPSATSDSISTDGNVQTTTAVTTDKPTDQPSATSDSISTDGDVQTTTAVTTDKPTDQPSATSDSISTDGNVQTTTAVTTDKPTDQPSATSDSISTDGDVQTTTAVTTDKPTDQPSATSDSISTDGNVQTTTAVTTDKPTDQPSATSDSISTDGDVQTTTAVTTDKPTDQPSATSDSISTDGNVQTTTAVTTDKPTDQPSATSDSISTDGNVQTTTAVTTDKPSDQPSSQNSSDTPSLEKKKELGEKVKLGSQVASQMLYYMNHSTDECEDFYEYACGGFEARNTFPKYDLEKLATHRIFDQAEKNANSPGHNQQFLEYYKSCVKASSHNEPKFEQTIESAKAAIDDVGKFHNHWDPKDFDLTNMLSKLLLRGSAPLFDITRDVVGDPNEEGQPNFILKLGPPVIRNRVYVDKKESECYKSRSSATLKDLVDLTSLHDGYTNCTNNVTAFLDSVEEVLQKFGMAKNTSETTRFDIEKKLIEPFKGFPSKEKVRGAYVARNYEVMSVAELQSNTVQESFLNWTQLLNTLTNSTGSFQQPLQVYFSKRIFGGLKELEKQIFNATSDTQKNVSIESRKMLLHNALLGVYAHKIYQELVVPQRDVENDCKRIAIDLMGTHASKLYMSSFSTDELGEMKRLMEETFEKLKTTLYSIVDKVTRPESFDVARITKKIQELKLEVPDRSYYQAGKELDPENSTINVKWSDNFLNDSIMLINRKRQLMYNESPREVAQIWTHFALPYQTSGSVIYELNKVIMPYAAIDWPFVLDANEISSRHLVLATLGTRIANLIAHHFDPIGIKYVTKSNDKALPPDDTDPSDAYQDYVRNYKKFAESQPAETSMKLPNKQNVVYKIPSHSLNQRLSDITGLQLAYDAMLDLPSNSKQLVPWLHPTTRGPNNETKQFFLAYAQMHCTKVPLTSSFVTMFEDENLPSRLRIALVASSSDILGRASNCETESTSFSFPQSLSLREL